MDVPYGADPRTGLVHTVYCPGTDNAHQFGSWEKEDKGGGNGRNAATLFRSLWLLISFAAMRPSQLRVLEFSPQPLGNALPIAL